MATRMRGREYAYGNLEPFDHVFDHKNGSTGYSVSLYPNHSLLIVGFDHPGDTEVRVISNVGTPDKKSKTVTLRRGFKIWWEPFTLRSLLKPRAWVIVQKTV